MHENADSRDSARREDPVAKELRFDRVTKEGKQKNIGIQPSEANKRSKRRTHGRETQQAEKEQGRAKAKGKEPNRERNPQENQHKTEEEGGEGPPKVEKTYEEPEPQRTTDCKRRRREEGGWRQRERTPGVRKPANEECKEAKQELARPKGRPRRGVKRRCDRVRRSPKE